MIDTDGGGVTRARSHCCFAPPLIHFIPDSLMHSVPLSRQRQCARTLGVISAEEFYTAMRDDDDVAPAQVPPPPSQVHPFRGHNHTLWSVVCRRAAAPGLTRRPTEPPSAHRGRSRGRCVPLS
jgi:hypothetical protein